MTPAKEEYSELYEIAGCIDNPAFNVLEYFIEESEEDDLLALTDEFIENQDRPYISMSQLEKNLKDEDLKTALHELTGDLELTGYLESNDRIRRSDYHKPHDSFGHMTDEDIRKMTEYKKKIDRQSPDELSFRLGEKVDELNQIVGMLTSDPDAREVYQFIEEHEDAENTDYGYPELRGVTQAELKQALSDEVSGKASELTSSFHNEPSLINIRNMSPEDLHDHIRGEPNHELIDRLMIKTGVKSEYHEEDLEEFSGSSAKIYTTKLRDMNDDPVKQRLVKHLVDNN